MGNIGPGELLIIALIALLLFGAGRIADIGKGLGQGIQNFKKGLKESDDVGGKPATGLALEEGAKGNDGASDKKAVATKEA
jgi:sec-independent protein translocase protein TatA